MEGMFLKAIGVAGIFVGIGGLAGWAETEMGFIPSVICLSIGIIAFYYEGRLKDEIRAWKRLEDRRKRNRR